MLDMLQEIFSEYEDKILYKGNFHQFFEDIFRDISLTPMLYTDEGEEKIRCLITIEIQGEEPEDEDLLESVSDYVSDFCRDRGLNERLEEASIDSDLLDWWPVEVKQV